MNKLEQSKKLALIEQRKKYYGYLKSRNKLEGYQDCIYKIDRQVELTKKTAEICFEKRKKEIEKRYVSNSHFQTVSSLDIIIPFIEKICRVAYSSGIDLTQSKINDKVRKNMVAIARKGKKLFIVIEDKFSINRVVVPI